MRHTISGLRFCKQEVVRLRAGSRDHLSLAPHVRHLVYVVDDIFIARGFGYMPRAFMELQFEKIGLFDGVHEVCNLLPYAKIFLPEIQSKLDSRKSMTAERVAIIFCGVSNGREKSAFRCGLTRRQTIARIHAFVPLRINS